MKSSDSFSGFHPVVNFLYFLLVIFLGICLLNPVSMGISFAGAVSYYVFLKGKRAVKFTVFYMLPLLAFAAVTNPLFNHEGATILTYFPSGNPLTLESILYGIASAVMLVTVIMWFACYTEVMTSDKFLYLFGKVIPAVSLVISMILRFIPKFKAQLRVVRDAQKCMGRDIDSGTKRHRMKNAVALLSILITWALENAVETADSMRSRGYGEPGRTAFSIYKWDNRDRMILLWLGLCGAYIIGGWIGGGFYYRYFPTFKLAGMTPLSVSLQVVYLVMVFTPVFLDRREEWKWKKIQSSGFGI